MSNDSTEKAVLHLENLDRKMDVIIGIMQAPENKLFKILEMIATVAGVLSLLGIVDVLRNLLWP